MEQKLSEYLEFAKKQETCSFKNGRNIKAGVIIIETMNLNLLLRRPEA